MKSSAYWDIKSKEHVPPKCQLTYKELHGVLSQKIELFITTTLRTSDSTKSSFPSYA
jgi:hypothetical protein